MREAVERIVNAIATSFLGNRSQVELALACLLAGGHLLIEDLPGLGKTTLARALARALWLEHTRLQFASDLQPGDILGLSVFDQRQAAFVFQPGPIFTQVLLADEINRATPRTQSALLEAMAEAKVSIDGETRVLPQPFFVIATQNPAFQSGTYPLPESQLDRFLMRLSLGFPESDAERSLLQRSDATPEVAAVVDNSWLQDALVRVRAVFVGDSVLDYIQRLIAHTRTSADFRVGLSPRGGMALVAAARAMAAIAGRDHLLPEDVQSVAVPVIAHRIQSAATFTGDHEDLVNGMLERIDCVGRGD